MELLLLLLILATPYLLLRTVVNHIFSDIDAEQSDEVLAYIECETEEAAETLVRRINGGQVKVTCL